MEDMNLVTQNALKSLKIFAGFGNWELCCHYIFQGGTPTSQSEKYCVFFIFVNSADFLQLKKFYFFVGKVYVTKLMGHAEKLPTCSQIFL